MPGFAVLSAWGATAPERRRFVDLELEGDEDLEDDGDELVDDEFEPRELPKPAGSTAKGTADGSTVSDAGAD